jgi:3-ketosteroid 9alpha-monooxygenase subunit A
MVATGWYLLRFLDELDAGINAVDLGGRALLAVRDGSDVSVYDATCPHRGAHLGYGGTLDRDCVVCPFHGKRISLGGTGRLAVARHYTVQAGAAVFVRLGDEPTHDRGFEAAIKSVAAQSELVGATTRVSRVPATYVVENAFDVDHFLAVHKVPRSSAMTVELGPSGELHIDGQFRTAASPWVDAAERERVRRAGIRAGGVTFDTASRFSAVAHSPHVVITWFGEGPQAAAVITGGLPLADGGCEVRVAVGSTDTAVLPHLVAGAQRAIAEDLVVWDHLDPTAPQRFDSRDRAVVAFRQFCTGFPAVGGAAR